MTPADNAALRAVRARIRRSKNDRLLIVATTLAGFLSLWEIAGHLTQLPQFEHLSLVVSMG
jgi:hypothetical protein